MFAKRFAPFGTTIFSEMTKLADENQAINLAQGFPDFDAPGEIIDEAVKSLKNGLNQYARSMGHGPLVEAIAHRVRHDYGLDYDPHSEVIVSSGATEGIASAFLGLLNPGDEVIFFEPHYDSYPACAAMADAVARFYTLRFPDFSIDMNQLEKCFTKKTRIMLINTPHNPTGKVFSRDELEAIAELCIKYDVVVVTDEVYEHLTYSGLKHLPMAAIPGMRERTLTISGAGKTFSMTGWRIGWATGPARLIAAVQRAHQYITFAPATPLQAALAKVLHDLDGNYFENLRHEYEARRKLLLNALQDTGFRSATPMGTYYILADFTGIREGNDRQFVEYLIKHCGVAAIPPSVFYTLNPDEGRGLVRFAFCKRIKTLSRAAEALRRLR